MSVKQNKNKKFLSSFLCALLCSSNSNVSSIIERIDLAAEYNSRKNEFNSDDDDDDDENYAEVPWDANIDKQAVIKWLASALTGCAINKKFFFKDSSFLDDAWSGIQWCGGYNGASELAKVLGLNYSQLAKAVSSDNKKLDAKWAKKLGKLADELKENNGWVSTPESLSTYWQLTLLVSSNLDLSFGKNTSAFFKKFLSNQSPLGTSLLVDKEKTLANGIVKPFTEDGGYLEDGLTTFEGKDTDYWFAKKREWLIGAGKSRSALFSLTSAMLQTYYVFYKRKMWDDNRYGRFNNEGNPSLLTSDTGTPKCIYEKKVAPPEKWAWKTDSYVYVRVPCIVAKDAYWNGIPIWDDVPMGQTAAQKFENAINVANNLATWLGNSGDLDSKQNHCRYIAIPLK